jgi:hypothetical protein
VPRWWRRLISRLRWRPGPTPDAAIAAPIERPWLRRWDHLPKRSAGLGFSRADYAEARDRAPH